MATMLIYLFVEESVEQVLELATMVSPSHEFADEEIDFSPESTKIHSGAAKPCEPTKHDSIEDMRGMAAATSKALAIVMACAPSLPTRTELDTAALKTDVGCSENGDAVATNTVARRTGNLHGLSSSSGPNSSALAGPLPLPSVSMSYRS